MALLSIFLLARGTALASKLPPFLPFLRLPLPLPLRNYSSGTTDLDLSPDEPIVAPSDPQLRRLLTLIDRASNASKDDALESLRASGMGPTRALVLSAMRELSGDPKSLLLALRWGEGCVGDYSAAWNLVVRTSVKDGRFDIAWSVLRRMHRRKIPVRSTLVVVMERYVAMNQVDKAIKTFHAMDRFNIFADSAALYALLNALCKNGYVEKAEQLLFLDRKLFPLETEGFNAILNGWCNIVGDMAEAKRVWREMSACCVCADNVSYSHMISCSSRAGNLNDSLRLYDEMKKKGWAPDLPIYNSLIYVLIRENCLNGAYAIRDKIKEAGFQANAGTYNSMIRPLCELSKLEEARGVLREMVANGFEPTVETFHALAMVEDAEGTLALIEKMRNVGCGPSKETFLIILNNFFRLEQPNNALRLWAHMRRYGITPDSSLYDALIKGLFSCKWISKAHEFYKEMMSKGIQGDPKFDKLFKEWRENLARRGWRCKQVEEENRHQVGGMALFENKIFH